MLNSMEGYVISLGQILGITLGCCRQGDFAEIFPFDEVRTRIASLATEVFDLLGGKEGTRGRLCPRA